MTDSTTRSSSSTRRTLTAAGVLLAGGIATAGVIANADAASGPATTSASSSSSSSSTAARPARPAGAPLAAGYDSDGTVTSVSSSSLTVRDLFGTSRTYSISSKTSVHSGPATKSSASSIKQGQHVHVHGQKSGSTLAATDVDLIGAHIDGTVTAVSSGSITVTDRDGFTRSIAVTSATKYTLDGATSSSSAVKSGRVVQAQGSVASNGTSLDATIVAILTKAPTPPAGGPGAGGPAGGPGAGGPGAPAGAPKIGSAPRGTHQGGAAPSGAPTGRPSSTSSATPSAHAS